MMNKLKYLVIILTVFIIGFHASNIVKYQMCYYLTFKHHIKSFLQCNQPHAKRKNKSNFQHITLIIKHLYRQKIIHFLIKKSMLLTFDQCDTIFAEVGKQGWRSFCPGVDSAIISGDYQNASNTFCINSRMSTNCLQPCNILRQARKSVRI